MRASHPQCFMACQQRPENHSYADVTRESINRDVRDVPAGDESSPEGIRADAALVERCRVGEVAAWSELYAQCHDSLLASISIMLGPQSGDLDLIDELAARVLVFPGRQRWGGPPQVQS